MVRPESQGKLPRYTENNPKHNLSAISLRSMKSYKGPSISEPEKEVEEEYEEVLFEEENVKEKKKNMKRFWLKKIKEQKLHN